MFDNRDLLNKYTDYLLKNGYTDTDVYCEEPKAVDRFIEEHPEVEELTTSQKKINKLESEINKITIGSYTISLSKYRPKTHIWIKRSDGEGSEFLIKDFEGVLSEYYNEKF